MSFLRNSISFICLLALSASFLHAQIVDPTHDVITRTFKAAKITVKGDQKATFASEIQKLEKGQPIEWKTFAEADFSSKKPQQGSPLFDLVSTLQGVAKQDFSCALSSKNDDPGPWNSQFYIFHVSHWSTVKVEGSEATTRIISSNWYIYRHRAKGTELLSKAALSGSGDPLIYGDHRAFILGIDIFDPLGTDAGVLASVYSTTLTQTLPENWANLGSVAGTLAGVLTTKTSASEKAAAPSDFSVYAAATCQEGTKPPFSLQISNNVSTAKPKDAVETTQTAGGDASGPGSGGKSTDKAATASPGVAVCTGDAGAPPCTLTRTYKSIDHEFWDISAGIATPGVRETGFTFSSSSGTSSSITRHTDVYLLGDFYPFGALVPKESWVPHISAGIPVTSKSFYRPAFGVSENLTGWTGLQRKLGLPVGINVFVGAVYLKTQTILGPLPTTQAGFDSSLKWHRVWKPMFGIEIPVGSALSKLTKSGNSSGSSGGGGKGNK